MSYEYNLKTFETSNCDLCGAEYKRHALRRNNLCDKCNEIEVKSHSTSVRRLKTKDPLYKKTVEHFNHKCAYCQERKADQIEHFIPLKLNGETSPFNCVPTCRKCNNGKATYRNNIPGYKRVKKYLEDLQAEYPDYDYSYLSKTKLGRTPNRRNLYYDEFQFSSFSFPGRQHWMEEKIDVDIRKKVSAMMLKFGLKQ